MQQVPGFCAFLHGPLAASDREGGFPGDAEGGIPVPTTHG